MTIIYSLVARGNDCVLSEYSGASGNFPQITRNLLKKIKPNTRLSYSYNTKFFFYQYFINY